MRAPTYAFRQPEPGDIEAAYGVIRAVEIADTGDCDFTLEDLEVMRRLGERANSWIVEDADGDAVAYAHIHVRHSTRLRTFAGVVPEHRGKGIGTRLVQLLDERARELAPKAPAGEPVILSQSAGHLNTDTAPLLERHGYEYLRTFWKMGIELDGDIPEPDLPEGIEIEPMRSGSEREIYEASEDSFRDHWDHIPHDFDEWSEWHFSRESFDRTLWQIAYDGDEIAGVSLNFNDGGDEAWVGILGVRPPWRRHGLGTALLLASFHDFKRRGITRAALGVDSENPTGATRLYERAGMRVVSEDKAYAKEVGRGEAA